MESPFEAEIEAIDKGVSKVEEMGGSRVLFLSDYKEAIITINGAETLENRSGFTVERIRKFA